MTITKLDFEYDFEFTLFGISCHQKDYVLCWQLNRSLNFQLKKQKDFTLSIKSSDTISSFSYYNYYDELNRIKYSLLGNHGTSSTLIPEYRQADYFIIADGATELLDTDELLNKIRNTNTVLAAFTVNPKNLKNKKNLILE
jgi:hypothetical protein